MAVAVRRAPEQSKAAILEAATELFARGGYDRTSLAEIGEAAGVSRGLPGYFFGSKEQLYAAVVERMREEVGALVTRSVAGAGSIDSLLKHAVAAYIDYLAAHPHVVRLLQWEFLHAPDTPRQEAPVSLFYETAAVLTRALHAAGLKRVDPIQLLLSIVGMSFFPFIVVDKNILDTEFVKARKKHVLDLLLGGIKK